MSETLPSHWSVMTLGAIATEIRNGIADKPADEPPGLPILRISAVRPGRVNLSDSRFHRGTSSADSYHVQDGDLLFIRYNGNPDLTAVCGMVRSAAFPCVYPDKLIRVRLDQTIALPAFVEFAMALPDTRRQLEAFIKTAAGQYGISGRDLREASIPLPPLAEQRRIVTRIEALFARTRRARADLERVAPLTRLHRERSLAAAFPAPEHASDGTTVANLLAEPAANGISVRGSDEPPGIRALRLDALRLDGLDLSRVRYIEIPEAKARRLRVRRGDFFVSRGNGSLSLLARGAFAEEPEAPTVFPDTMIRLRFNPSIVHADWLALAWGAPAVRMQIAARAKTTAGIWKVSQADLETIRLLAPGLQEQSNTARRVRRQLTGVLRAEHEATRALALLDRLEQSILARAFRGELVPQYQADEPSAAILSRQRATPTTSPRGKTRAPP